MCGDPHGRRSVRQTKTYTNMLAVNLLAAIQLSGGDGDAAIREMRATADAEFPAHLLPKTSESTRPLVKILPMQMLTLVRAKRKGLQAGHFRLVT